MLQRQVGDVVINRIIESERPDFDAEIGRAHV